MFRNIVGFFGALVLFGQVAKAADQYDLKIETSFAISESCTTGDGRVQSSRIQLMIDSKGTDDPKALTPASTRINVCSPWTNPINQTMPLPLPIGLMKAARRVAIGQQAVYPVRISPKLAEIFKKGPPDMVIVTKTSESSFELRYINSKVNELKVGPVRAFLASAQAMAAVPGFDQAKHLPIARIEIDVPEKRVTLRADIQSVQQK